MFYIFDVWFFEFGTSSFWFVLVIQLGFALISISPVGAYILRVIYGSRKLETMEEREYLLPIFHDVYESVKENYPNVNKGIELYIDNDMSVNAYAVGSNTITITRGAAQLLTEEELKGIFAHEFGHIVHGDTFLPLFMLIGNSMFLFFMVIAKCVKAIMKFMRELMPNYESLKVSTTIVTVIAQLINAIILFIVQALLLINQRKNEYQADKYAYETYYGENLIKALYRLNNMNLGGRGTLLEKIKSSHPNIEARIGRLESMTYAT